MRTSLSCASVQRMAPNLGEPGLVPLVLLLVLVIVLGPSLSMTPGVGGKPLAFPPRRTVP
jgi:hypothetical protein